MTREELLHATVLALTAQNRVGTGGARRVTHTATGEKEPVCTQGDSELNRILLPRGTRYCTMYVPDGYLYLLAASPEPFTLRCFSNETEESVQGSGTLLVEEQTYHYAWIEWYSPKPTPLVECITPARTPGRPSLSADQVVVQGLLYLYG